MNHLIHLSWQIINQCMSKTSCNWSFSSFELVFWKTGCNWLQPVQLPVAWFWEIWQPVQLPVASNLGKKTGLDWTLKHYSQCTHTALPGSYINNADINASTQPHANDPSLRVLMPTHPECKYFYCLYTCSVLMRTVMYIQYSQQGRRPVLLATPTPQLPATMIDITLYLDTEAFGRCFCRSLTRFL